VRPLITLLTALWWLLSSALHSPPLSKVALPLRRALETYITNCPLAFVPYCQYSVFCKVSPLQHLNDGLRDCHFSHPQLHRLAVEHRLGLVSLSPRSSAQASCISAIFYLAHESSRQRCSLETIPCTAVDAGRCSASESVVHPRPSSLCVGRQDSVVAADLRGVLLR
jgi:hypothetical protein